MNENKLPVIGISQGDINGIGLEVIIKTFNDPVMLEICTPVLFSSGRTVSYHRKTLAAENFNYNVVHSPEAVINRKFNLINCYTEEATIELGKLTASGGLYAIKSLQAAREALSKNKIDALVTAPIHKHNVQSQSFPYIGHTQYLEEQFGKGKALMMLVSGEMSVALVTVHIPISSVSATITTELILNKIITLNTSLKQDFSITKPRIAVLGLNPHAGDLGTIGNEEEKTIAPAIKTAIQESILAYGPFPADGFFGGMTFKKFDAVLAMYHDQGLIPFKFLAFENGVNFTAGLPIIRTSPDHGTAFDIAGKNKADENSFRYAVYMACDLIRRRRIYREASANPLKASAVNVNQRDE